MENLAENFATNNVTTIDSDYEVEAFTVRDVTVEVQGITPYSQSAHPGEDKEKSETWEDFEDRVWRKKSHTRPDGSIFIPGSAFKLCLDECVKNMNEKVGGKGNQTWTKIFEMGIAPITDMDLGVNISQVPFETVFCHANGKRGPGTRVNRKFPIIHEWGGSMTMRIFNDNITKEKFQEFFVRAGLIAGVGRGRPSTGCPNGLGRFRVLRFEWSDAG